MVETSDPNVGGDQFITCPTMDTLGVCLEPAACSLRHFKPAMSVSAAAFKPVSESQAFVPPQQTVDQGDEDFQDQIEKEILVEQLNGLGLEVEI